MSAGHFCTCPKDREHTERKNWVVLQYKCNHSAFNGYHETSSDYSAVRCTRCGQGWRTKAAYVESIPLR